MMIGKYCRLGRETVLRLASLGFYQRAPANDSSGLAHSAEAFDETVYASRQTWLEPRRALVLGRQSDRLDA
jgi:hypothetical protein